MLMLSFSIRVNDWHFNYFQFCHILFTGSFIFATFKNYKNKTILVQKAMLVLNWSLYVWKLIRSMLFEYKISLLLEQMNLTDLTTEVDTWLNYFCWIMITEKSTTSVQWVFVILGKPFNDIKNRY